MTESTFGASEFAAILAETQQRTGIHFRAEQLSNLQAVLARLMKRLKINSANALLDAMRNDLNVFHAIVDEITIGETYFFREPKHFEFVRRRLMTDLRSRPASQGVLRAWSAACAAGEEAYSLAILCQQESQPADIMASDISPAAISKARRGEYRQWSFRGDSLARAEKYLSRAGENFRVHESILNQVRFQVLNLASDAYPSHQTGIANFDLIFCRNVLIYFDRQTVDAVARRLLDSLTPGGWLVTASGDPPLRHVAGLNTVSTEFGTFYQRPSVADPLDEQLETATPLAPPAARFKPFVTADKPLPRDFHAAKKRHARSAPLVSPWPATEPTKIASARPSEAATGGPLTRILAEATAALAQGDHALAMQLTGNFQQHARACALYVRAAAHHDLTAATQTCAEFAQRHPLDCELHYLHARFLLESERLCEAAQAAQKAIFLDSSSAMSHFLFGTIQIQRSKWESARRHFENSRKLCERYRPQDPLPLSDDATAADVARAAESQLMRLNRI